jgi:leader peptidase (prepilin peptidase) / N-methyltransferase
VNVALVVGCGAGGLVIGTALDLLTGRIVRSPDPAPEVVAEHEAAGVRPSALATIPAPAVLREDRRAGPGELALSAVVTGAAFGLLAARLGAVPVLAAYCALACGLVAASAVDLRIGLVPRSILYPTFAATAVGLAAASAVDSHWRLLADSAIGGAAAFGAFFALWWVFPRGIGFGDVRLAGVIGAALGWIGFGEIYVGFVAAFVVGTVVGLAVMAATGTGRKTRFAFGPWLSVGAAFGIMWGPWAVHLWLGHT